MRVFISWSGEPSRSVAQALREWLPLVVQHVEPWMSDADIESGRRWNEEVAAELELADYGIICLTAANIDRPWVLFEAGALAKQFDSARVVPLLVDLNPADVTMPLASFQSRSLNKEGMRRLVLDLAALREGPMSREQVDALFDGMWPRMQSEVEAAIKSLPAGRGPRRSQGDMLAEIIDAVRLMSRRLEVSGSGASSPHDQYAQFGYALRQALYNARRTQTWLANQLYISPGQVSRWVNGRTIPHVDTVRRIEELLEVELMQVVALYPDQRIVDEESDA
jgi:hypothetical protein